MLAIQRALPSATRPAFLSRTPLTIQAAHKKGSGSTKNGRDSNAQRRGVKVLGGQPVKAGGIIVRQVGSTWAAGDNVGTGKDYTLFSTVDGIVVFKKKKAEKSKVHVVPMESEEAKAIIQKTHTIAPKEGVPSRRERRKAMYTPRAEQRAAAQQVSVATVVASVKP